MLMLSYARDRGALVFVPNRFASLLDLALRVCALPLFLAGCASPAATHTTPTPTPQATLVIQLEADRYAFTTPATMCQAPMIADVVAGPSGPSYWNTDNEAPPSVLSQAMPSRQLQDALIKGGYMIYTPIQFTSMTIVFDHRSSKQPPESFVLVGGQQGTTKITVAAFPHLTASTRYLVVLVSGLNATTHQPTLRWQEVYDAFPIDAQNLVMLQAASAEPGRGTPQPEVKMPLATLLQHLAGCP
jgi:hypothetical protein